MKNNIDISEFDKFFKDGLENAVQTPPAGVWESVSGSLTTSAATTTTAAVVKTALWLKVGIAIISTSAVILGTVYLTDSEKETMPAVQVQETPVNPTVENNTPTPLAPIENPAITQADQPAGTNEYNKWIDVSFPPKIEEPQTNYNEVPTNAPVNSPPTDYNAPVIFPADVAPIIPKAVIKKKDTAIITGGSDGNEVLVNDNIVVKTSDSALIIPNAFTPNGDGINDTYMIDIKGEVSVRIVVLDRNGSKIFETTDKTKGWDPTIENYPVGTYYVVVYYKFPNSPENKHSQTIILKR